MLNTRGMDTSAASTLCWKVPYIEDFVMQATESYSIISITETWLKPHITDAQLHIEGYTILRSDRCKRGRGGCCLYIQENFIISDYLKYDDDHCQVVGCSLDKAKTLVFSLYRPPGDTPHKKFNDAINFIKSFVETKDESWNIIITGDFNLPNICWDTLNINRSETNGCSICAESLLKFMESKLLSQVIDKPTRVENNGTENILDLIITNNVDLFREFDVISTSLSDHELISVVLSKELKANCPINMLKQKKVPDTPSFSSLNFLKADFDKINNDLEKINWEKLKSESNVFDFPITFYETLLNICYKYTPLKKSAYKKRRSKYYKVCYAINRKRRKVKARLKALQTLQPNSRGIAYLKEKLVTLEKEAQHKILYCKHIEEKKALDAIRVNPRYFYSYAKQKSVSKTQIGPLRDPEIKGEDQYFDDPKRMADILQNQFISVFSNPDSPNIKEPNVNTDCSNTLHDIVFNVQDLLKAINEIKINSSSGDDGFPAILLKKCKDNLVFPLLLLWRESVDCGFIHPMFLHQLITPLYKGKGSRCEAVNYRPISLTSHIIKVFERVIRDKMVKFLEENDILSCDQHGFRKGRSCLSELLAHYDEIVENANDGKGTDTVYLDFAKAFDKVDHQLLLKKLEAIGIKGKLSNWIKAFLSNRKQEVVVNGFKSFIFAVLSGVPQGSVLGPILFIVFINDIAASLQDSKLKSFADDTKISCSISCQQDAHRLQEDLNRVMNWSIENNMALNESKFEFLKHNYDFDSHMMEMPFSYFDSCYKTLNSSLIECNHTVKDLGITFSADSTFNIHIANIVKNAKDKAAWALSVFKTRNKDEMMLLYKTYIRSQLEYCCPLWNPSGPGSLTAIKLLEGVQRTFTAKISSLSHLNYWQRLKHLNLMSLQRRRERYIIIHMWKILTGKAPNDLQISFYMSQRSAIRAVIPDIPLHRSNLTFFDKSFSVLGPKLWNLIPRNCTIALHSLDKFKQLLDAFILGYPDLPPMNGYTCTNSNSLLDWTSSRNHQASYVLFNP